MKRPVQRRQAVIIMAAILLLATALRFHLLEAQSFWNDEGNSARLSERSVALIVEGTASDIHPPLYYLLLRGWRELAGETEFGLRALSTFSGIALVAAAYALGRQLTGPKGRGPALIGAFLTAVSPALIYYSQETRMYELLALLALLSTLLLVHYLQHTSRRGVVAVGYVVAAGAGLYTHYFFPAVLLAQNLIVGAWLFAQRKRGGRQLGREVRNWLLMMLAALLVYSPWLPIFFRQAGDRSGSRIEPSAFLQESAAWLTAGPTWPVNNSQLITLVFLLLVTVGAIFGRSVIRRGLSFSPTLLIMVFIPLLMMWILGATQPAYFKFMLVIIPPFCLLAGAGWWWGWYGSPGEGPANGQPAIMWTSRRLIVLLLALPVLWFSFQSLSNMYDDPAYARADYRGIAAQIAAEAHPNAAVLLNAANQWEVFTYYHREGESETSAPVFPIPRSYPDPGQIDEELKSITTEHDRLYALFWGETQRDPNRLVERWLEENAFKAREEWVGDVRFVTYAVADAGSGETDDKMAVATNSLWADSIELLGYTLNATDIRAGDIIQLTLFWRGNEPLNERYKVFIHLLDEQGQIVAQRDSEPGGGLVLTTTWLPGETVVDNHGLLVPLETANGDYTVLVGLYALGDPSNRLEVETSTGVADALPIGAVRVGGN